MLAKQKINKERKKENVKSCIIYEICIKEKCNSIINKILIQVLELMVPVRVFAFIVQLMFIEIHDFLWFSLASGFTGNICKRNTSHSLCVGVKLRHINL